MERRLWYSFEIGKFTDILNECFCYHQCQNEKVRTNATIYCYGLLKIHDIGGQRSLQLLLPALFLITAVQQPGPSSPQCNPMWYIVSPAAVAGPHWRDEI